jgi:hypothetical protein
MSDNDERTEFRRIGLTGTLIEGSNGLKHCNLPKSPRPDGSYVVKRPGIELNPKHFWKEMLFRGEINEIEKHVHFTGAGRSDIDDTGVQ